MRISDWSSDVCSSDLEHYFGFGGKSPINDQNRALLAAIREDFSSNGIDLPVYWGNRNWDPYLPDTLAEMLSDGIKRAACFVTSDYSSYSGCLPYSAKLTEASRQRAVAGKGGVGP